MNYILKIILIFFCIFAVVKSNASPTKELTNSDINLILSKKQFGVYKLKNINKKVIVTFFDEKNLTISEEFSEVLKNHNINLKSQNFLIKLQKVDGYVGIKRINPYYHIGIIEDFKKSKNSNDINWIKYYKRLYGKNIFNDIEIIKKELINFSNINISMIHINYITKELTNIPEELENLELIASFHHEVGHIINEKILTKNYLIDSLEKEMFSDLYSLLKVREVIKNSNFLNKKEIFEMYANWLIELRNKIKLNDKNLNIHYTVPAIIEGKKYILNNWTEDKINISELSIISKYWSEHTEQYKKIKFKESYNEKLISSIKDNENIDKKIMYSQNLFKRNIEFNK